MQLCTILVVIGLDMSVLAASLKSTGLRRNPDGIRRRLLSSSFGSLSSERLKVAVVGVGAVGSYYGARLWESGHDVQFHMRGVNYQAATENGLKVTSIDGNITIPPDELCAFQKTKEMSKADWVVVALKSTALGDIPALIAPLLHSDSRLLVIMNGLVEQDLISLLKQYHGQRDEGPPSFCRTFYGGMAFICCNRIGPAVSDHSFYGPLSAGVAGRSHDDPEAAKTAFLRLFDKSKVAASMVDSLSRERWRKSIWNLAFNGISVAMGGITVDKIVEDPGLRSLAENVMAETICIANEDLRTTYGLNDVDPLTTADVDFMMSLSDTMGPYRPSTMIDLLERRPMETQYISANHLLAPLNWELRPLISKQSLNRWRPTREFVGSTDASNWATGGILRS